MIAIVAPMKQEVWGLRKASGIVFARDMQEGARPEQHEGKALLCVTGVGKRKAQAGVNALLDGSIKPDAILSLGFAGALRDDLNAGDLVLSQRLYATGEDAFIESDARLLGLAQDALIGPGAPRHFVADNLTVPRVVSSADGKKLLGRDTTALVVNMEDYWTGKAAMQHGIPFLSVRAVLDTVCQELPPSVIGLGNKGLLRQALQVLLGMVSRPGDVSKIANISKHVKVAQGSLTAFGISFLTRPRAVERGAIHG